MVMTPARRIVLPSVPLRRSSLPPAPKPPQPSFFGLPTFDLILRNLVGGKSRPQPPSAPTSMQQAGLAAPAQQAITCRLDLLCETKSGLQQIPVNFPGSVPPPADTPLTKAVAKIAPATVYVAGQSASGAWSGSGVILDPSVIDPGLAAMLPPNSYLVLTNHHVATDENTGKVADLFVTLSDGRIIPATALYNPKNGQPVIDPLTDMAFLIIQSDTPLATAQLADEAVIEGLKPGHTVFTSGYPAGLPELSVTAGVISSPNQQTGDTPFRVIQVDAAINPGNSGGPLVLYDPTGQNDPVVLGLNTFGLRNTDNMGFAHPVTEQLRAARAMYADGKIVRGDLGSIEWAPWNVFDRKKTGFPEGHGAVVEKISVSPLDRLKAMVGVTALQAGDVVTVFTPEGGEPFRLRMDSFWQAGKITHFIHGLTPGTKVDVVFYRPVKEKGADGKEAIKGWQKLTTTLKVKELKL